MNCTNLPPLGLSSCAAAQLQKLFGAPAEVFYSTSPTSEAVWRKSSNPAGLQSREVPFITNTWSDEVDETRHHLADGLWVDIDNQEDLAQAHRDTLTTAKKLEAVGVDPACCSYFASGGKGFHIYIPLAALVPAGVAGVGKPMCENLALTCKGFVMDCLVTESTDFRIYNGGKGRIFRQPNVQRPNGKYKVQISLNELRCMDPDGYAKVTEQPRPLFAVPDPVPITAVNPAWVKAFTAAAGNRKKKSSPPGAFKAPVDTRRARRDVLDLLRLIGPCEYGDWLRVGSAIKSVMPGDDGLEIWDAWSRRFKGYRDRECSSRWSGLDGRAGMGTLAYLAKAAKGGLK